MVKPAQKAPSQPKMDLWPVGKRHLFYTLPVVGSLELLILFARAPFLWIIVFLEVRPMPTALEERA